MQMEQRGEYWRDRFSQMEKAQNASSEKKVKEIQEQFDRSLSELNKKITVWYQRLADNNGVSMKDARKLLDADELREFRWSVEEYIKYGRENAKNQNWEKELENASARVHIRQLEALKYEVMGEAEKLYGKYADMADGHIKNIYTDSYYRTAYEIQKNRGIGSNIRELDKSVLEKLISKPWAIDGRNFSERIWQDKTKLINTVYQSLTKMCITGSPAEVAVSEVAKAMNISKSQARRLVMTESAAFANKARYESMSNLEVKEYEVVETLDSHTCGVCGTMDKKHYRMKDFEIGVTAPPFHPQCRGGTCPYFNDEYTIGEERAARGDDGKTYFVPAHMTYKEWKRKFIGKQKTNKIENPKATDVTEKYMATAMPNNGLLTYGGGYKTGRHKEEVKIASWLHDTYGGDITLLNESSDFAVKMPDFSWNGKLWELKTTSTPNATDNAVRKALKQIRDNPGGIILDYGNNEIDIQELKNVINRRVLRSGLRGVDVMILSKGRVLEILRYKK